MAEDKHDLDPDCNAEQRKSSRSVPPPDHSAELLNAIQEYNQAQENAREVLRLQQEAEKRMVPPKYRKRK